MSLLKTLLNIREIKSPTFAKEFKDENEQLKNLKQLLEKVKSEKRQVIESDFKNLKQGIEGEKRVAYELKNSFIPMIILHDIRIEFDDKIAQLDFVVITEYFICVLETKLLNGDIQINNLGEFNRKINYGKFTKREGIYSPIAQNDRHIRILTELLKKNKLIRFTQIESMVVIANPKSIIDRKYAPKEIKNNIIKYDQITKFIKQRNEFHKKNGKFAEDKMLKIADFLISKNTIATYNLHKKYSLMDEDFIANEQQNSKQNSSTIAENTNFQSTLYSNIDKLIENKLKNFRLEQSKKEGKKPFMIFSNATLEELIIKKPKNKNNLLEIKGFGEIKATEYGAEILNIINSYMKTTL